MEHLAGGLKSQKARNRVANMGLRAFGRRKVTGLIGAELVWDGSIVAVEICERTNIINSYILDRPDKDRVIAPVISSMQCALEIGGDTGQYWKAVDSFVIFDGLKLVIKLRCKVLRKITLVLAENINDEGAGFMQGRMTRGGLFHADQDQGRFERHRAKCRNSYPVQLPIRPPCSYNGYAARKSGKGRTKFVRSDCHRKVPLEQVSSNLPYQFLLGNGTRN